MPATTPQERSRTLLVCLLLAVCHLVRYSDPHYVLDDAWISFRSALHWGQIGVPAYNREGPPVEAMTNLGFTALLATVDPAWMPLVARLLGGLGWLTALGISVDIAARLGGWRPALATGLVLAASPSLNFHAFSGLETGLWCVVAAACLRIALLSRASWGAALGLGSLLAAGFTLRPEVALYGPALVVLATTRDRRWLWALAPFAFGLLAVETFRWACFGSLVPNTFYAKPATAAGGLDYLYRFLRSTGLALPCGLLVAGLDRHLWRGAAWGALVLVAVLATGGDWMDGFRRLSELALVLGIGLGVGIGTEVAWKRGAAWLGLVTWAIASGVAAAGHTDDRYTRSAGYEDLASRARDAGVHRVGLADIGVFGWIFPGEIFDTGGLADPVLAHSEGTHGLKWSDARLDEVAPEVLVVLGEPDARGALHFAGPNLLMLRSALQRPGFRVAGLYPDAGRTLIVLARDGDVLDPAIWGQPAPESMTVGLRQSLSSTSAPR